MSDWQIDIPFKDRSDLVLDTIKAAKEKFGEGDQRTRVVEVLANDALFNHGVTTVGQLIDGLGALDRAGVRARLDWARGELGLPSTGEVERRREDYLFEAALNRLQPPPPPKWSPLQRCAVCGTYPMDDSGWKRVEVERWHCPAHEDLAQPGDMEPHQPAYIGFNHNGTPIPSAKQRRRIAEWVKKDEGDRERERQQREEHDKAVAEAAKAAEERWQEEGEVSVMGVRVRPGSLRIIR